LLPGVTTRSDERETGANRKEQGQPWTLDVIRKELRTQQGLRPARKDWRVKAMPGPPENLQKAAGGEHTLNVC
jgi:hypothetical protein